MTTAEHSDPRSYPPPTGGERAMLQGFLDYHRETFLWKIDGLTAEQLALTSIEPSTMSLLGMVRHLTEVERYWFQLVVDQRPIELVHWTDEHPDGDFDLVDPANAEDDFAQYRATVQLSDEIGAKYDLDHEFSRPRRNATYSVRWLYLHLIEEYARHNGHVDLLRERIDGITGD